MTTTNEGVLSRNTEAAVVLADGLLSLRDGVRALHLAGAGLTYAAESERVASNTLIWIVEKMEALLTTIECMTRGECDRRSKSTDIADAVGTFWTATQAAQLAVSGLVGSACAGKSPADALLWLLWNVEDDTIRFAETLRCTMSATRNGSTVQ